jgi:SRSO17 transposase
MLRQHRASLPHVWIAGDDEMGRSSRFRRDLRELGERYLLAVPSNSNIRDLAAAPPAYGGHGPPRQVPWQRVDRWREKLPACAWTRIQVGDGEKEPLVLELATTPVLAHTERQREDPAEELLVVTRTPEANGGFRYDYYLSNAPADAEPAELARVIKAAHRIEENFQRAKSEAGLSDYEVRTWIGWHHHQTLCLIATWFLISESRRAKKIHPGGHGAVDTDAVGPTAAASVRSSLPPLAAPQRPAENTPQRIGSVSPLSTPQPVGAA